MRYTESGNPPLSTYLAVADANRRAVWDQCEEKRLVSELHGHKFGKNRDCEYCGLRSVEYHDVLDPLEQHICPRLAGGTSMTLREARRGRLPKETDPMVSTAVMTEPRPPEFTVVYGGGWMGLYADGDLVCEGHEVTLDQLARAANLELRYERVDADKFLRESGGLPGKLANVVSA